MGVMGNRKPLVTISIRDTAFALSELWSQERQC